MDNFFIFTLHKVGAHFGPMLNQLSTQHKLYNLPGDVYMQEALHIWIIRVDIEEWIAYGVKDRDAGMKDTTCNTDPSNRPILKLILHLG
jgi:hypothetical protein